MDKYEVKKTDGGDFYVEGPSGGKTWFRLVEHQTSARAERAAATWASARNRELLASRRRS